MVVLIRQNLCKLCFGNLVHYISIFVSVWFFLRYTVHGMHRIKITVWLLIMAHSCVIPLPPSS